MILERFPDLRKLEKKKQKTWNDLEEGKGIYEEAMKEYFLKNERFLKEQAGILAGGLEEGTPCPVCGSLHHPSPAVLTGEPISQEDVREARKSGIWRNVRRMNTSRNFWKPVRLTAPLSKL